MENLVYINIKNMKLEWDIPSNYIKKVLALP